MAKTMRRIVFTAIMLIVIAGGACWLVLTGGCSAIGVGDFKPFSDAQVTAMNKAIDMSGIKSQLENELRTQAQQVAEQYGIPAEILETGIDDLAIQDWKAIEKPEGVTETGSYSVDADGTQINITTYDDPGIVGIGAYGLEATLEVPESARPYTSLIPLIDYRDEIDRLGSLDLPGLLQQLPQLL